MLRRRPYEYLARPRLEPGSPTSGGINCRSLIQDYLEDRHQLFLRRDRVEFPHLWYTTGTFIDLPGGTTQEQLTALPDQSLLFCERIRGRDGRPVDNRPERFTSTDDYRLHLHTALLLHGIPHGLLAPDIPREHATPGGPNVLHATSISMGTALWGPDLVAHHYKLIAAKRLR